VLDNCTSGTLSPSDVGLGDGGSIVIFPSPLYGTLLISHVFFKNSRSHRGALDVSIRGNFNLNGGCDKESVFYLSRSQSTTTNTNKLIIGYEGFGTGKDKSCLLPPYLPGPTYVSCIDGTGYKVIDRQYCGTEIVRCKTLNYADGTLDSEHDYVILVGDGSYEEWKVTPRSSRIRDVRGESTTGTKITVVSKSDYPNAMFSIPSSCASSTFIISSMTLIVNTSFSLVCVKVASGSVEMNDLVINSKNAEKKIEKNIIEVTTCSYIKLTNVKFENILLEESAIKIGGGDVLISGCEFNNIESLRNSGQGGVLHLTVDGMKTVELTNECCFWNCSIETEAVSNGGAIYTDLKAGYFYVHKTAFKNCSSKSSTSTEGKGYIYYSLYILFFFFFLLISGAIYIDINDPSVRFDLSNTTYEDCKAKLHGDNVFICGSSLSHIITPQKFQGVEFTSSEAEKFHGQWKENQTYISLIPWMSENGVIYVSEDTGADNDPCGSSSSPCLFVYLFFFFFFFSLFYLFLFLLFFFFFLFYNLYFLIFYYYY
jgi:hypothetical protein